tara:strand:- start:44 stop:478 length:435 start_codon:yes stop_codon:yes gene_type:complete
LTLDQILEEWRKDSKIDTTNFDNESTKIPVLHSKYLKIYYEERKRLKGYEFQYKEMHRKKYEYYNGRLSQQELEDLEWEPFVKRLMKNEIDTYIQSDKDILQLNARIANQLEKNSCVEDIIKNINQRNFQIKNAIEWKKFTQGL